MSAVVELKSAASHKDLYAMGEIPPLGHVPAKMHAWVIRKERHGPPLTSMQLEVVPTWSIGEDEVLGPRDGRRGELQRHLGGARRARSRRSTATRIRITSPGPTRPASSGRSATR